MTMRLSGLWHFIRIYGTFTWRIAVICGTIGLIVVGTEALYSEIFIRSLNAQTFRSAGARSLRGGGNEEMDPALRDAIVRSTERIDQLNTRVAGLEAVRPDARLTLIESKLDTQSWFVKVIFGAAIAQFIGWIAKGVSWAAAKNGGSKIRSA